MFRRVWLIGIAVCVAGHALAEEAATVQQPAAPVAATPAAAPANASTTVAKVDEAAPVAEPAAAVPEGKLDAEKIMAAQKAGYQIRNEDGQQLLCRKDLQTGSRVRYKTSCMTAREWDQLQSDTSLQMRALERRRPSATN